MVHLCLAMMIKNEEKTLLKSFNSCKDIIKSIRVYDTGSTDKTLEIIEQFAQDNPEIDVYVKEGEFVDFAVSRNVLLEYVEEDDSVDFVLLLDSNDEVQGTAKLLEFLKDEQKKTRENTQNYASGYLMRQRWFTGNSMDTYYNIRLIRARQGWRYHAPVHEYIQNDGDKKSITARIHDNDEIVIYQDRTQDCENTFKRFQRDKDILLKEHLKNPDDPRTHFYLAQTYGSLGMQKEAYYFYKLRTNYYGFLEERYHSFQRLGEIAKQMHMEPNVYMSWWIKAMDSLPVPRVEPIIELANYYLFDNVNYHMASLFTSYALTLEYPHWCTLFINRIHYDYTRYQLDGIAQYYLENYEQGLASCRKAIQYNEKLLEGVNEQSQRLIKQKMQFDLANEKLYQNKLQDTSNATAIQITKDAKWYKYTPLEMEECILTEYQSELTNNVNTERHAIELDILLKSWEKNKQNYVLLFHIGNSYDKIKSHDQAYQYYKLFIDKIQTRIKDLKNKHQKQIRTFYNKLLENHALSSADDQVLKELEHDKIRVVKALDENQIKQLKQLEQEHNIEREELYTKLMSTLENQYYYAHYRLGDLAKILNHDSTVSLIWWIQALSTTKIPRIAPLIKIANHYIFQRKNYHMANMFLQYALKLKNPSCKDDEYTNKLHYNYSRYHLDGIIHYYLGVEAQKQGNKERHLNHMKQGADSCQKAIDFCKHASRQFIKNRGLHQHFAKLVKANESNLKFYNF